MLKFLTSRKIIVSGSSMEPDYPEGDIAYLDRVVFALRPPRRGEVVAFRSCDNPERIDLKRIIGLPNEKVEWISGRFYIDGNPFDEPYARGAPDVPGDDEVRSCHLGSSEYFVAGDNRLFSSDCRHHGPVKRKDFLGLVYKYKKTVAEA